MDKEEQFTSRKTSSEGQEKIKMETQGVGSPTQATDYTKSLADFRIIPPSWIRALFGVLQITGKVLVQSKNLLNQKDRSD